MLKLIVLLSISAVALGLPWFHLPSVKLPYFGGGRIVGGNDVDIEDYPYTLVLLSSGQFFCGAVLIDEEWALTAATCVSTASASSLSVRAGSTLQSSGGQVVSVSNVIVNPDYDSSTHDLDLALLQLSEAVTIETAAVAQLRPEPVEDGEPAEVAGWGTVESGGDTSETLQVAELSIVGREDCQNIYTANDVTENMICAGDSDGNRDACQGDAGGPLIVDGNVVGIVSWGYSTCGTAGYPGVYASIAAATPWIFETISGGSSPAPPSDLPSPPSDFPSPPSDFPSPPSDFPSPPSDFPSPPSDFPSPPSDLPSPPSDLPSPPSDLPSPPSDFASPPSDLPSPPSDLPSPPSDLPSPPSDLPSPPSDLPSPP
ncbi:hypothetical protein NQ317_007441, partial [Molorchus minor]